ncbi:MAG: hypothetical protein ACM3WV_00560 [Bacillota bacterium]
MSKLLTEDDLKILEDTRGKLSESAQSILQVLIQLNNSPEVLDVVKNLFDGKKMGLISSLLGGRK